MYFWRAKTLYMITCTKKGFDIEKCSQNFNTYWFFSCWNTHDLLSILTATQTRYHIQIILRFFWLGFTLAGMWAISSMFGLGLTLGRLIVILSNISKKIFRILFSLLSLRNPCQSFRLFSVFAISSNAALIWLLDDFFSIVYFEGNSSIASETLVAPILTTPTCQLWK